MTTTKFEELRQYGCEGIRGYNNCLLVKKVPRPECTVGGIIIPDKEQADSRKDTFPFFEILSAGPDLKGDSLGKPAVGDYVIFERSVRMQLPDGFELWTLPEQQILALVPSPRKVTAIDVSSGSGSVETNTVETSTETIATTAAS